MNPISKLILSFIVLFVISCKKDKVEQPIIDPVDPFIAPCSITETNFDKYTVFYGPSTLHLEAKYRILFMDTASNGTVSRYVEYAFNNIPTSGKYSWVDKIDTNNLNYANQIAFAIDSGSFLWRSNFLENVDVFIKKTEQELIISYCNADTTINFDPIEQCFKGVEPASLKLRAQF